VLLGTTAEWLPPTGSDGIMRCANGGGRNNDLWGQAVENDVGRFGSAEPPWFDCAFGSETCDAFPVTDGQREHEPLCPQMLPAAPSDGCDPEYAIGGMRNIGGTNVDTSGMGRLVGATWADGNPETG